MAKKEAKKFWFVDTRENAKTEKPFAIYNSDVAKSWTRDFNNDEGPFKPVKDDDVQHQINRRDLKEADKNTVENQQEANEHNMKVAQAPSTGLYDDMNNDERKAELDARGIEYPSNAKKDDLIALLENDDKK